jgi:putative peptidoglycan lipid II flippase
MTLSQSRQIAKNASVVAVATLASRIRGFVRDAVVAATLGAGLPADAFFVAFRVPNVLRRLFAEGSMTMSFIPVFQRLRSEKGEPAAFVMARSTLLWLLAVVGAVTLLAEAFAGPLTALIAPGFARNPGQLETAAALLRVCFPYILLISAVGLCMGILNSLGHFLTPALSPVVLNVCLIIAALTGWRFGWNVAWCLSWGVLAGGLCQFLSQLPALRAKGFSWRGERSWRHPGVARMGRLMLPTVFGAAVYQINTLLGTLLASFLAAGSISYLYYADRLVEFPLGVFGLAVSTAALPSLSALAATGKTEEFRGTLSSTLRLTLFVSLPAMAGLMALARPIVLLLFGRGRFDAAAVVATAQAVMAFALGLPFAALARPLASAWAWGSIRTWPWAWIAAGRRPGASVSCSPSTPALAHHPTVSTRTARTGAAAVDSAAPARSRLRAIHRHATRQHACGRRLAAGSRHGPDAPVLAAARQESTRRLRRLPVP